MNKSIGFLLPPVIEGSGGLRTVFNNVKAIRDAGYDCHVYVQSSSSATADLTSCLLSWYALENVHIHAGWHVRSNHDVIVATMWHTAEFLKNLDVPCRKAYFIQDYEPAFYAMGTNHIAAEQTYSYDLYLITLSRWLESKMFADFGVSPYAIDFCADESVYKPLAQRNIESLSVCFIYQPEKPHRGPMLGLEALAQLKKTLPHVTIYLFGSNQKVSIPFDHVNLGLISPKQINELYNMCSVGLCISMTNPSRIPFEMMAAGLPVIDIYRENNLFDMPDDGVLLADPTPESIRHAMVNLLSDNNKRTAMGLAGASFMVNRPLAQESSNFVNAIETLLSGDTISTPMQCSRLYTKPAVSGSSPLIDTRHSLVEYDLLSFDVWDTILRRRCHPDEVKLYTSRYLLLKYYNNIRNEYRDANILFRERVRCELLLGRSELKRNNDDEYSIGDVFDALLKKIWFDTSIQTNLKQISNELVVKEVCHEKFVTFIDKYFLKLVEQIQAKHKYYLSDFYMGSDLLTDILRNAGVSEQMCNGFVSCDVKRHKRSGNLFLHLFQETGCTAGKHIHIGDNEYSDYFIPKNLGGEAILFSNPVESRKREEKNRFHKRQLTAEPYLDEINDALENISAPKGYSDDQKTYFEIGVKYSLFFYNFIFEIIEQVLTRKVSKLFFFTREGEFFQKIYETIRKHNPTGVPIPESDVLEVSRIATFAASITEISTNEFMRIWNLYSSQSVSAFFKSLAMDITPFLKILRTHRLNPDETIVHPWQDSRMKSLFADPDFRKDLIEHIQKKRDEALAYFQSKGIENSVTKALNIVDIGWRGTIQDNLCYLFPDITIHGHYLGLLPFLNDQPPNSTKNGYITSNTQRNMDLLSYVAPIEMLCNSSSGSVLSYTSAGSTTVTIRDTNVSENAVYLDSTRYFQEGILTTLPIISSMYRTSAIASYELKECSIELFSDLMNDPPKLVAEAYFRLNHNETFGTGTFEDKKEFMLQHDAIWRLFLDGDRQNLKSHAHRSTWPQGFLKHCGISVNYFNTNPRLSKFVLKEQKKSSQKLFNKAVRCYQQGNLEQAKNFALYASNDYPDEPNILYFIAKVFIELGHEGIAIDYLREITYRNKTHGPSYNELSLIAHSKRSRHTELFLTNCIENNPCYSLAYINLAKYYLNNLELERAISIVNKYYSNNSESIFDVDILAQYFNILQRSTYYETFKTKYLNDSKYMNIASEILSVTSDAERSLKEYTDIIIKNGYNLNLSSDNTYWNQILK